LGAFSLHLARLLNTGGAPRRGSHEPEAPVRVLFVNDHLGAADGTIHGGTVYLSNTLPAFDPERVEVALGILRAHHPAAERFAARGVDVRFFGRSKWDPRALLDIIRLLREWRPDIVHLNGKKAHLLGRLAALWTGTPAIIHLHFHYRPWPRWLNRALAGQTALAIAPSEVLREHAIEAFGMSPERSCTIRNGLDVARFADPDPEARARIRRARNLTEAQPVIALCGRISTQPDKGQQTAIRAMREIVRKRHDAVLLLIGEGPARNECEALVAELGLTHAVQLLGHRNDIPDVLSAADIVMVPSACNETFSFAALEAMCARRPVVASRDGALTEALGDGERGILVDRHDAHGFARAVLELINDRRLSAQLGEAGYAYARNLTLSRHTQELTALYAAALSARHVAHAHH
jgi:glycosyltransferase involved in cell wall biosynthesis